MLGGKDSCIFSFTEIDSMESDIDRSRSDSVLSKSLVIDWVMRVDLASSSQDGHGTAEAQ